LIKDIDRIIKLEEIYYPSWNNGLSSSLSNVLRPSFEVVKKGQISQIGFNQTINKILWGKSTTT
jgi:hypothetical protein